MKKLQAVLLTFMIFILFSTLHAYIIKTKQTGTIDTLKELLIGKGFTFTGVVGMPVWLGGLWTVSRREIFNE